MWSYITQLQNLQNFIFLLISFSIAKYYHQYIWRVYGRLGRKRRKVIPAFVVLAIQISAGKKARVARKVLRHSKSQGGFSVVSVELKIHSLLGQWFRRFGVSPGAWVSLLTFWCFDRFGVSPMSVLSQPSTHDIATLSTFFYHCFLAWIALGGSLSLEVNWLWALLLPAALYWSPP